VSRLFLDLVPKNEKLREAFRTYLELQRKVMSNMSTLSEIPKEADPVDYAIYFSVKSFCEAFLNPELKPKLLQLEREISRVELDQQFVVEQAK
jgi:hypothetical protein